MSRSIVRKRVTAAGTGPAPRSAEHKLRPWDGQLRITLGDNPRIALLPPGTCEVENEVPLEFGRAVLIGRSPAADLRVHDRWASRYHCELFLLGEVLFVRDIGSTHGTMINEKPRQRGLLHDGDVLHVGLSGLAVSFQRT